MRELTEQLLREPTTVELAEYLGWSIKRTQSFITTNIQNQASLQDDAVRRRAENIVANVESEDDILQRLEGETSQLKKDIIEIEGGNLFIDWAEGMSVRQLQKKYKIRTKKVRQVIEKVRDAVQAARQG